MSDAPPTIQSQEQAAIYQIMKYLLRKLAEEQQLDTDALRQLPLPDFLAWAPDVYRMLVTEASQQQLEEFAQGLGVNLGHLKLVSHVLEEPYLAAVTLVRYWPALVLSSAELIEPAIKFLHFSVTVGFADGTMAQVQIPSYVPPGLSLNDGHVVSAWMMQLETAIAAVREHGVLGLRKLDGRRVEDLPTTEQELVDGQNPLPPGEAAAASDHPGELPCGPGAVSAVGPAAEGGEAGVRQERPDSV